MSSLSEAPLVEFVDRETWRAWLQANHAGFRGAWLVMNRQAARMRQYEEAVEEALCFGWIDSTTGRVDDQRNKLYFAQRKPRSVWAASNKARVERLIAAGRMAPAGLAVIERAKANGSWELLDSVERLEVPADLAAALAARPPAAAVFASWSASMRKQALGHIVQARRAETRAERIRKISDAAARNARPF